MEIMYSDLATLLKRKKYLTYVLNNINNKFEEYESKLYSTSGIYTERVQGGQENLHEDKLIDYIQKTSFDIYKKVNNEELSLFEYREFIKETLREINKNITYICSILGKMDNLESKLSYLIIVDGLHVTKAVEKLAILENLSDRNVWRVYKRIKKYISYKI